MSSPKDEATKKHAKEKKARKKIKSPKTAHPLLNHEKSTAEQSHLLEGPEYIGPSVTVPTHEGVKDIAQDSAKSVSREVNVAKDAVKHAAVDAVRCAVKDTVHHAVRSDSIPTTRKNAPVRLEPETKPLEERSLSSSRNLWPPGPYEHVAPFALLSIGGRRSSAGHYRTEDAALVFRRRSVMLIVAALSVGCIILTLVVYKLLHSAQEIDLACFSNECRKELNVSAAAWLKESAPERLFADVVRVSFVHGFHSLFEITSWKEGNEREYAVDVQPSFNQRVGGGRVRTVGLRRYLSSVLEAIVTEGNVSGAILDEIVQLDIGRLRNQYNEAPNPAKINELVCGRFSGPTWVDALNRLVAAKVNGASVETRQFDAVCDDLNAVLVQTTSAARPLYLMALMMAHVVQYDYRLSGLKRTVDSLRESCYEETSVVFGSAWPSLLTRLLSVSQASQKAIDGYFGSMLNGSIKQVLSREWMTRADALATITMLENVSLLRFSAGMPSELCGWNSEDNASLILTPTDFIRNKVALQNRKSGGRDNCDHAPGFDSRARLLHLLKGTAMVFDSATKTLVVPHAFGLPPLYYPQLQEEYANVAVLGVQMTLRILGFTFTSHTNDSGEDDRHPWSQETLARYRKMQSCYALLSPAFHDLLSDDQFDLASAATDAIELAYSEKARLEPTAISWQRVRATSALFFKRACLALCQSVADDYEPDEATLHASCLMGVANVPRFYEVFACAKGDHMTHIRKCFEN